MMPAAATAIMPAVAAAAIMPATAAAIMPAAAAAIMPAKGAPVLLPFFHSTSLPVHPSLFDDLTRRISAKYPALWFAFEA